MNTTRLKSTNPPTINQRTANRQRGFSILLLIVTIIIVVLLGVGGVAAYYSGSFANDDASGMDPVFHTVSRQDLRVTVNQPGTIEARNRVIVRSGVRERVEITYLVDEGTLVRPGDVLVRLDSTALLDRRSEHEQNLENARSNEIAAEVNLENTISQANSTNEQDELNYELAQVSLKKYLEGEYPQDLKQAQGQVEIALETLKRARNKAEWSKKLNEEGYITQSEAEADEAAAKKAQIDLEVAQGRLDLLRDYTFSQQKRVLESDVDQLRAALQRSRRRGEADIEKARAELRARQLNTEKADARLKQTLEDIEATEIAATVAGRVVYAPQGNRWRSDEPLSVGSEVRFGTEIIHLPEAGAMNVSIKIDESQRDKVEVGMPVDIKIPSISETTFRGRLSRIAVYLDPSGWWNNYMKVYSGSVEIQGDTSQLRNGMNAQTEIIAATLRDVMTVPVQSVIRVGRQPTVYVRTATGVEPRPVEIGQDNGRFIEIISGLAVGDQVMLNPPLSEASRDNPDAQDEAEAEESETKAEKTTPSTESTDEKASEEKVEIDPQTQRIIQGLQMARDAGRLDALGLDAATLTKINEVLNSNGTKTFDEATLQTIRSKMRQMRNGRQRPATSESSESQAD